MSDTRTLKVVVVGNSRSAQSALRSLGVESRRQERNNSRLGGSLSTLGGKFATFGKVGAAALGLAAAASAKFTLDVGMSYEKSLNALTGLTGQADKVQKIAGQLEGMSGKFAKLGFSTGDAASGMVELVKAGNDLDSSLKLLPDTLVLARAGELSVADAATLASDMIHAFKLEATDMGRVANVLAQGANLSSVSIDDMRQALQQVSTVASTAHISIEDTAAAIAFMGNMGIKGSDAGTSLKTFITRLTTDVNGSAKALRGMGVSVFDSAGKMKPFAGIVSELSKKMQTMSDKKRSQAIYTIFGSDAQRAANAMGGKVKNASQSFDTMRKSISQAGAAQRLARAQTAGFVGFLTEMKARSVSAADALYRKLAPGMTTIGRSIQAHAMPALKNLGSTMKNALTGGSGGRMGEELRKLGPVFADFGRKLLPVFVQLGNKAKKTLLPALRGLGKAISEDFLPGLRKILPVIRPVVAFLLKMLGGAVIGVLKGVIQALTGAFQIIGGLFKFLAALVHGDWGAMWDGVKTMLHGALNAIVGIFTVWMNVGILSIFKKGGLAILKSFKGLWTGLKNAFTKGTEALTSLSGRLINALTLPFRKGFSAIGGYLRSGWQYIKGTFTGGVGSLRAILGRVVEVVTYPYRRAFSLLRTIVTRAWPTVKNAFTSGWETVWTFFKSIPKKITGLFSKAGSWLVQAGKDVINGLLKGAGSILPKVGEFMLNKLPGWIRGPFKKALGIASPSKVFAEFGKWTVLGYVEGITANQGALSRAVQRMSELIKGAKTSKSHKNHALALLASENKQLAGLIKKRDTILNRLSAAQSRLADLRSAKADLASGIAGQFREFGGIMNAFSSDEGAKNTPAAILTRFREKLATAQKFAKDLAALTRRGLSNDLVKQIAESGVEAGGAMAASLSKATPAQIAELNKTGAALAGTAKKTGNAIAGQLYDAGIRAADGLVRGLQRQEKAIEAQMLRIARSMTAAIKRALGIKSPSRVFMKLGGHVTEGFAQGITGDLASVDRAMDALSGARPGVSRSPAGSALSATASGFVGGQPLHVEVHVHGSVSTERELVRAITEGIRDAQRRAGKPVTV